MAEERVGYNFDVSRVPSTGYPSMSDCFKFDVTAILRDYSSSHHRLTVSSLFTTSILINCNSFFNHNENFLWLNLQRFSSPYFNSENLALMTLSLISKVKQLFGFSDSFELGEPFTSFPMEEIPLVLRIIVDVHRTEERVTQQERMMMERASVEESMQFAKTIPASNEAVLSLRAFSLPRNCTICMERFHDDIKEEGDDSDDVKVSTMPCGHIFHYNCIVKWLQKGHVCPLCRYAMPI